MTREEREEAINEIKQIQCFDNPIDNSSEECNKFVKREMALNMAIEALEQEPTYYPPCIDCNKKMDEIRRAYDKLKEQKPKTGHWIEEDMFDGDVAYRCSECDELFWLESGTPKDNEYNFCPKCGAKLESEEV